jgi:hypothetical protein
MKRTIIGIGAACAVGAALCVAPAGGAPIAKSSLPPSAQRQVAQEWSADIAARDQRAACGLQTIPEVEGKPCSDLPFGLPFHCPKHSATHGRAFEPSDFRKPAEQVGALTEESPTRGFVDLYPKLISRKARAVIGVELVGGAWRVSYLRQGDDILAPAGTVAMSAVWGEFWGPVCYRRK